jgi:hypothetical protein
MSPRRLGVIALLIGSGAAVTAVLAFGVDLRRLFGMQREQPVEVGERVIVEPAIAPHAPDLDEPDTAEPTNSAKVVLVVDESASMQRPMLAGPAFEAMTAVRNALDSLLSREINVRYGLVLFGTDVLAAVPLRNSPGTARVRRALLAKGPCPYGEGPCGTATWEAIRTATRLLDESAGNQQRFIILFTDGLPGTDEVESAEGIARTRSAIEDAWAAGITIFTVQLVDRSEDGHMKRNSEFLVSISGNAEGHARAAYHRIVTSAGGLDSLVKQISSVGQ